MNCGEDDSPPPYITSFRNGPYSSSIASSASSSTASVWSDAASSVSDDSSVAGSSDNETSETYCCASQPAPSFTTCEQGISAATYWPTQKVQVDVAPAQRTHPRRTSVGSTTRTGCPPALVRQCDRKVNFVDSLVGKITCKPRYVLPLNNSPTRFFYPDCRSNLAPFICPLSK